MKVLVSSDLLLDALLNPGADLRKEFTRFWELLKNKEIEGHILEVGLDKLYSYLRMWKDTEAAERILHEMDRMFISQPISRGLMEKAYLYKLRNFEYKLHLAYVVEKKLDALVVQYPQDFTGADLPVLSVRNLLRLIDSEQTPLRADLN